jgi:hypothetical protein
MSIYTFNITKGKYKLTLSTEDKDFVNDQFELWVRKASEYVQKQKIREGKDRVASQIEEGREATQRKIDEQLKRRPVKQMTYDNAASKPIKDDKNEALDVFYAPPKEAINKETGNTNAGFDSILDKSIHSPQTELSFKPSPSIKKDNAFLNYINGRNVTKKIDYLLLTAYYFSQFEQKPRFTLKQLNAKLMQNIAVILDNSVIQEAINRDYIECLPDLTGVVGASEYRLTAYYFTQYEQKPRFTLKQLNAKLMQNIAIILDHSVVQEAINRDYIECLPDLTGIVGSSEYRLTAYGEKPCFEEG